MSDSQSLLEVEGLFAGYGPVEILHDVSFDLAENDIASIVGPNGAGKTTLINSIAGLLEPTDGAVRYRGADITTDPTHERLTQGISLVPERRHLFRSMTVRENLILGTYRNREEDRDQLLSGVYKLFPRLEEREGQKAGTLSGGEAQMLTVGRALMTDPDLLLLDEPTIGLAPQLVPDLFDTIREINERGVSIVLVEQRVEKSFETADYGYLLENGEITMRGPTDELLKSDEVVRKYLGGA